MEPGRLADKDLGAGPSQPRVDILQENASRDMYTKMIRTAYELALNSQYPLTSFKLLVKCQRMNGVRLVDGKDDCKATGEFFDAICKAVAEKVAAVIASKKAMSLMSDGSQARKTKADKEMVLVRVIPRKSFGSIQTTDDRRRTCFTFLRVHNERGK